MASETKLEPCPFCSSKDDSENCDDASDSYWVECMKCGVRSGYFSTEEEATAAWNTRATPPH